MASSQAEAAKLIRKDLKEAFPSMKFKVTSESFSMGDSVNVRWMNGPTSKEVDKIIRKYQYGHFNGMEDIYEYSNQADFPQSKFVSGSREIDYDNMKIVVDAFNKEHGMEIVLEQRWCEYNDCMMWKYDDVYLEKFHDYVSRVVGPKAYNTNFLTIKKDEQ